MPLSTKGGLYYEEKGFDYGYGDARWRIYL